MEFDSKDRDARSDAGPSVKERVRKSGGLLLIVAGLLLIGYVAFDLRFPVPQSDPVKVAPLVGSLAPNFTLTDLAGHDISLKELRGKYVVINFWATWCGPCQVEMPHLQARHETFGEELVILAVNYDESKEIVQSFVDDFGLTFPVVLDPGAIVQEVYEIRAYPTTYFIDREGVIRSVRVGLLTEELLDQYLSELGL